MKIITFQAASGTTYELQVKGDTVPGLIFETEDGKIHDPIHEATWDSLIHMTNDLKLEIVSWGSEIGD